MIVATPSGVTLAPEGGAHQSIHTPLIGIGQPGLLSYEPAYVDELAVLMRHGLDYMQQDKGGSVYLRLSTRSLPQPQRTLSAEQESDIVAGGYWYTAPESGADVAIVAMGAVTPEAIAAHESVARDFAGAGLLVLTSPDRLHADWLSAQRARGRTVGRIDNTPSPVERLLAPLSHGWSPSSTAIRWRFPGWARCAASEWCRLASRASASRATFRTSIGPTSSIRRRSSTRWRAPSPDKLPSSRPRPPLDFARGELRAEWRDLLSTIGRLSLRGGLSAPRFALRSRRRK
jgi:hypothetical protein